MGGTERIVAWIARVSVVRLWGVAVGARLKHAGTKLVVVPAVSPAEVIRSASAIINVRMNPFLGDQQGLGRAVGDLGDRNLFGEPKMLARRWQFHPVDALNNTAKLNRRHRAIDGALIRKGVAIDTPAEQL